MLTAYHHNAKGEEGLGQCSYDGSAKHLTQVVRAAYQTVGEEGLEEGPPLGNETVDCPMADPADSPAQPPNPSVHFLHGKPFQASEARVVLTFLVPLTLALKPASIKRKS